MSTYQWIYLENKYLFTLFYISIIELREIIFAHLVHISINIFGQEYFCSYIEKHTWRKNICSPCSCPCWPRSCNGGSRDWSRGGSQRGRRKTWLSWSWSSCSPMTIIIIFTHDHAGYRQAVEEIADLENINITIGMVRIMFIIITITTIISKSESKYSKPSNAVSYLQHISQSLKHFLLRLLPGRFGM